MTVLEVLLLIDDLKLCQWYWLCDIIIRQTVLCYDIVVVLFIVLYCQWQKPSLILKQKFIIEGLFSDDGIVDSVIL